MTKKQQLAQKAIDRFPNLSKSAIAKYLHDKHKSLFPSAEKARRYLAELPYAREKKGVEVTNYEKDFEFPDTFAESYEPFRLDQSNILILSDLHIPYHHPEAIKLSCKYGKDRKANAVLINGDLMDFHYLSRFEKEKGKRSVYQEFEATRKFLAWLRNQFPHARIIFKEGNHDLRWERYLYANPHIFDDPELTLESRLHLNELGIEIVKENRPVVMGKLTALHGHELPGGGGVNPARGVFLKLVDSVVVGHYHRTSQHVEPIGWHKDHTIAVNTTGCLCELFPRYARINKWNLGFAFNEVDLKTGEFHLDNLKIINGKIYQ